MEVDGENEIEESDNTYLGQSDKNMKKIAKKEIADRKYQEEVRKAREQARKEREEEIRKWKEDK